MDVTENTATENKNTVDTKINETEKKGLDKTIAELMKKLKQLLRGMSQFTIFGSSFTQQLSQLEQQVEENGETTEEVAEAVAGVNNALAVIGTRLSENDKADKETQKETQIALNEMKEQLTELANQLSTVNEIRAQAKDIILDPNVGRDYNFATIQNEDGSKNFVLYNMYPSTNNVPSYYEFAVKSTTEEGKSTVQEFEVVAEREFSLADLTRMNELREQGRLEEGNELVNVFNETDDLEIRMNAFNSVMDEASNRFNEQAREVAKAEEELKSKNSGESYNYTPDAPIQFHQTSQSGSRDVEGSVTVETETNDSKETVKEEQEEEKDDYERDF